MLKNKTFKITFRDYYGEWFVIHTFDNKKQLYDRVYSCCLKDLPIVSVIEIKNL
jgi:hypothetical protein